MIYKAAVAGLPLGEGKAVILTDEKEKDPTIRAARFHAFGRFVESLRGRYFTKEEKDARV
jgi:leucine dehydrogenase